MPQGNQGSNPCPSAGALALVRLSALLLIFASTAFAQQKNVSEPPTLDRAKRQVEAGQANEAIATLDALDQKDGATGKSLDMRGRILMDQGQLEQATKLFQSAREKDKLSFGQLHFGDLLLREKKFPEAREAYRSGTRETSILGVYERLRFGMLLTYLGEKDDANAQESLGEIRFPSETGAYYYAQAAWAYAHGQNGDAEKWIKRCQEIFGGKVNPWFAQRLYDMGWTKTKPPPSVD